MILDFFHIAKDSLSKILDSSKERGEIKDYSIEVCFDDYKLDITVYPIDSNEPYKLEYKFERVKGNSRSGEDQSIGGVG